MFIEWDEKYSVKVKELDDQHKKLFAMLNEMSDAVEDGKGFLVVNKVVSSMTSYVKVHFTAEEELMQKYGYPEFQKHKTAHEQFVERVVSFEKGLDRRKFGLPKDVLTFLKDWLTTHILKEDMQYSSFFSEKVLT